MSHNPIKDTNTYNVHEIIFIFNLFEFCKKNWLLLLRYLTNKISRPRSYLRLVFQKIFCIPFSYTLLKGGKETIGNTEPFARAYPLEGGMPPCSPPPPPPPHPNFIFRTKQGPKVAVSNIMEYCFYGCLEIIRTKNFTILPYMLQFLNNLPRFFIFSNYIWGIDHFKLDFLKTSDA